MPNTCTPAALVRTLFTLLVLAGLHAVPAAAGDFFVTPQGAGSQDGSDWDNAAGAKRLRGLLSSTAKPGDRIVLGSGVYHLRVPGSNTLLLIDRSGTPQRPLTIAGIDTGGGLPVLEGRWSEKNIRYHAHSSSGIALAGGTSHVQIEGLAIRGAMNGVSSGGANHHVLIDSVSVEQCREGFRLRGFTDSVIRNCQVTRYTKRGIRFETGCRDLVIDGVTADATGGTEAWPIEAYPFGFAIEDDEGNRGIRFERCVARNNLCPGEPGKYWNGDGFLAEKSAGDLSYYDCLALDNSDGGWDDKSRSPLLVRCVAVRNKRGFRLWNARGDPDHPARLRQCLGVYNRSAGGSGSSAGLWLCGAVEAEHCTFHDNATAAVAIEGNGPGGSLVARNCILSANRSVPDGSLVLKERATVYSPEGVAVWKEGSLGEDPQYVASSPTWSGEPPDAFNSRRYGQDKGYWAESGPSK